MGECPWMGGLEGTIHDLLEILQEPWHGDAPMLRSHCWQHRQAREGTASTGVAEPLTKLGGCLMQKGLQLRVEPQRRREGRELLGRSWLQLADQGLAIKSVHSPP